MISFQSFTFYCLSIYDDVVPAFERWKNSGRNIYIYSSGSVQAQKLLFHNSDYGNLAKVFLDN